MTDARIPRSGRMKTSIWVDRENWEWFVPWAHRVRSSSCEMIDSFVLALRQTEEKIQAPKGLPVVNVSLSLHREVERPRRLERIRDYPIFDDWGSHLVCHFCRRRPRWLVYYDVGWDKTIRVYCCGYHLRLYRRMTSEREGYPKISFRRIRG